MAITTRVIHKAMEHHTTKAGVTQPNKEAMGMASKVGAPMATTMARDKGIYSSCRVVDHIVKYSMGICDIVQHKNEMFEDILREQ